MFFATLGSIMHAIYAILANLGIRMRYFTCFWQAWVPDGAYFFVCLVILILFLCVCVCISRAEVRFCSYSLCCPRLCHSWGAGLEAYMQFYLRIAHSRS